MNAQRPWRHRRHGLFKTTRKWDSVAPMVIKTWQPLSPNCSPSITITSCLHSLMETVPLPRPGCKMPWRNLSQYPVIRFKKYDVGRATAPNDGTPFSNFSTLENQGKALFLAPPVFDANSIRISGGAGCQGCHRAPEFDIAPNSGNNGVVGIAGGTGTDFTNTRSPSLRNIPSGSGAPNGPFMHDGQAHR